MNLKFLVQTLVTYLVFSLYSYYRNGRLTYLQYSEMLLFTANASLSIWFIKGLINQNQLPDKIVTAIIAALPLSYLTLNVMQIFFSESPITSTILISLFFLSIIFWIIFSYIIFYYLEFTFSNQTSQWIKWFNASVFFITTYSILILKGSNIWNWFEFGGHGNLPSDLPPIAMIISFYALTTICLWLLSLISPLNTNYLTTSIILATTILLVITLWVDLKKPSNKNLNFKTCISLPGHIATDDLGIITCTGPQGQKAVSGNQN